VQCSCEKIKGRLTQKVRHFRENIFKVSLIFVGCDSKSISLFVGKESLNCETMGREKK